MKIARRNNSRKRITVIYGKYGLKFSPETSLRIRNLIEASEKNLREGTAVACTLDELIQLTRSLNK